MDLVYILGTGSTWHDNEIRYSLRSVCAHVPHDRVFVVGEKPWFANEGIIHIPARDKFGGQKLRNSVHKLGVAVAAEGMGSRFLLMNDDFFFFKFIERIDLPIYHRGLLADRIKSHPMQQGYYWISKQVALDKLRRTGIADPLDYSVHFPMVMERDKVIETMMLHGGSGRGYLFRTVYANMHNLGGVELEDTKGGACPMKITKPEQMEGRDFFSTDEQVVRSRAFQQWIHERFPEKCRYEV